MGITTPALQTRPHFLMCWPEHFEVIYSINPWMNPAQPTDTSLAVQQWQALYDTYVAPETPPVANPEPALA